MTRKNETWPLVANLAEALRAEFAPDLEGDERDYWLFRREQWLKQKSGLGEAEKALTELLKSPTFRPLSAGEPWMRHPLADGGSVDVHVSGDLAPGDGAAILRKMADSLESSADSRRDARGRFLPSTTDTGAGSA